MMQHLHSKHILFYNIIYYNKQDASITVTHWKPGILETVANGVHVDNIFDHMLKEASTNLQKSQDRSQGKVLKMNEISERIHKVPPATGSRRYKSFSAPLSQNMWSGRRCIDLSKDESLVKILSPNGEILTAWVKDSALENMKTQTRILTLVEQEEDDFRAEYLNGLIRKSDDTKNKDGCVTS